MRYQSTRGETAGITFKNAVMMGLATDGGLLLPEHVPDVSAEMGKWDASDYPALAFNVMQPFIDDIDQEQLRELLRISYATFDDPLVAPLRQVGNVHILELFHGPTLAFKDVALQFLGNVFELILKERGHSLNILGATSGDTGSAAIAGVRGKANINIYIMFPEGKTSPVQELQMTSVLDDNVHNMAIRGSFDDCQTLLKSIFSDQAFKAEYNLAAVNSVNWARVLAQVVYYFSAWHQLGKPAKFDVTVPTGNFGNIFAGYLAKRMGLPIRRLILATNSNDILTRFFQTGVYEQQQVNFTHSPAMDIQISSNFERFLYYASGENPASVKAFMTTFLRDGKVEMQLPVTELNASFVPGAVSNEETLASMAEVYKQHDYLLDPHTAVGYAVAQRHLDKQVPLVCLATAHPGKFEDVVQKAVPDAHAGHPSLDALTGKPTRKQVFDADEARIKEIIRQGGSADQG